MDEIEFLFQRNSLQYIENYPSKIWSESYSLFEMIWYLHRFLWIIFAMYPWYVRQDCRKDYQINGAYSVADSDGKKEIFRQNATEIQLKYFMLVFLRYTYDVIPGSLKKVHKKFRIIFHLDSHLHTPSALQRLSRASRESAYYQIKILAETVNLRSGWPGLVHALVM